MERQVLNNIKIELLKRVDVLVQRHYHQTLGEFVNELYVRHLSPKQHPTADEMFVLLQENRVLSTMIDPEARDLRDAVGRLIEGTFGLCIECRHEIGQNDVEKNPTQRYCTQCISVRDRSYSTILEAMKSVEVFSW